MIYSKGANENKNRKENDRMNSFFRWFYLKLRNYSSRTVLYFKSINFGVSSVLLLNSQFNNYRSKFASWLLKTVPLLIKKTLL